MLRPPRRTDADVLAHHISDPRVARMLIHVPMFHGRKDAARWVAAMRSKIRDGEARFYAIERDSVVAGLAGLAPLHGSIAEIGYWLGVDYWGQGLMSEAAPPILHAAWQIPNLKAIEAAHMADNEASGRLLGRLGFRHTGTVTLYSRARGTNVISRTMFLERPQSVQDAPACTVDPAA